MGGHMLPGRERRRAARRSMRRQFGIIMAFPLVALAAGCALAGLTIVQSLGHGGQQLGQRTTLVRMSLAVGIGVVAILAAMFLMAWFTRRIARDVASLGETARLFADRQLPGIIERLRRGDQLNPDSDLPPPAPAKITEISRIATVLADAQHSTIAATASEVELRSGISRVFVSLARRNQSLLQRQLRMIDELERKAADPGALADLFPLDHLTTRMRRHAEGLIVLSGAPPGRSWSTPVPVIDVVRGAIAEVEDYRRVHITSVADGMMAGSAVADMVHLLAELIENATLFSPSGTQVEVRADRVGNGFAFEIEDRGLGIKPDDLDAINERLSSPTDFDLADADQLGLFVVGKLAARHGVRVFLRPSPYGGTTAIVVTPRTLVTHEAETPPAGRREPARAPAGRPEDMQLALTGRVRRDQPPVVPPAAVPPPARPGSPEASTPSRQTSATGPMPSVPRRRPSVPGRPDSVPMADTHQGLPRRVRQANLSPHLRNGKAPGKPAPRHEPEARSPEQARNLLSSLQRGWERGRAEHIPEPESDTGPGGSGHESPQQEG
jgi:signal transduction histidine kinase